MGNKALTNRLARELETNPFIRKDSEKMQNWKFDKPDGEEDPTFEYKENDKQLTGPVFNEVLQKELKVELDKIIGGEDLLITQEMRSLKEGEFHGFSIRRSCSNGKQNESEKSRFLRWNERMNR